MSDVERPERPGGMSAGESAMHGGGSTPGPGDPAVPGPAEVSTAGSRRRTRRSVALVSLAVAVVVAVLVIFLSLGDPQRGALIGRSAVGQPAPPILGVTLTGDVFDLDEQRGRWVVVNFFATWCPGCITEHPELVAFSERHAAGDAIVVTVAFDDSPEAVRGFFERAGGDWPVLAGDVGSVPVDYGVTAVPETYIVSPAGYVVDKLVGVRGVTADQLAARIAALEALGDAAGTAP